MAGCRPDADKNVGFSPTDQAGRPATNSIHRSSITMRNQVQPVTESRNFFPFNSTRSELIAMLLGLILVSAGLVLILRPSPPTLPNVMPLPHGITPVKPSLFERIVPLSWGWLWRFRELL